MLFRAILAALLLATSCWAQSLEGDWLGGWQANGAWVSVKASFKPEADMLKATLDVQAVEGPKSFTVPVVKLDQQTFRLETTKDATAIVLEGKAAGDLVKGHWQQAGAQGPFELLRVAKLDAKLFDQYVGSYRLGADNFIAIGRQTRTGQNPRLGYVERKSGWRGNLTPLSETVFIGGPALGLDYPADVHITFVKDQRGAVTGLRWRHGKQPEQTATTLKLQEEEVRFASGAQTLAGTLVLPPTKGPHPAIVLAHGSTPLHRHYFGADPYRQGRDPALEAILQYREP